MAKKNAAYAASVKAIAAHAKKHIAALQTKKKKAKKREDKAGLQEAIDGLKIVHAGITAGCQEMPQPGIPPGCQEMPRPGIAAGCQEMPRPGADPGCQEMPRPKK